MYVDKNKVKTILPDHCDICHHPTDVYIIVDRIELVGATIRALLAKDLLESNLCLNCVLEQIGTLSNEIRTHTIRKNKNPK